MEKVKINLFYFSVGLVPIGLFFRTQDWVGGNSFFTLGILGLFIFYIAKTIKNFVKKRNDKLNMALQILIVFMSVTFFTKYLYHRFGDYPSLLIVPLFIIISLLYLFLEKSKDIKLTITSILYLLMSIPLFGFDFHKSPRQYIPQEWYNRFTVSSEVPYTLPYEFESKETEELSIKANDLRNSKHYYEAIQVYRQAIKIEPKNPRLFFDISDCYARNNNLESGITALDTAILIDCTNAGFYNNRGLIYYKLNENNKAIMDYQKAIQLDSTQSAFFANIALVYYFEKKFNNACASIQRAERLGFDFTNQAELKRIKMKSCN